MLLLASIVETLGSRTRRYWVKEWRAQTMERERKEGEGKRIVVELWQWWRVLLVG